MSEARFRQLQSIVDALRVHGFREQRLPQGLFLVRPNDSGLAERIELFPAGSPLGRTVLVRMAICAVLRAAVQLKGLIIPGGLEDLCSDPQNGRVHFSSHHDQDKWAERLASVAPDRVRRLAQTRGQNSLPRLRKLEPWRGRVSAHPFCRIFVRSQFEEPNCSNVRRAATALFDFARSTVPRWVRRSER
jgi:hypothetical protein